MLFFGVVAQDLTVKLECLVCLSKCFNDTQMRVGSSDGKNSTCST